MDHIAHESEALLLQLDALQAENAKLKQQISQYKTATTQAYKDRRDLFFAHLLGSGYYRMDEDLHRDAALFDLEFPNPKFAIISIRPENLAIENGKGTCSRDEVNYILSNVLENSFDVPCYTADVQNHMVGIVNLKDCEEFPPHYLSILEGAIATLNREFHFRLRAVVSRVYDSPIDLSRAMDDVQLLDEYLDVMEMERSVTSYVQLRHTNMEPSDFSFLEYQTQLLGCARTNDIPGLRRLMHELVSEVIYRNPPTVDVFKFRIYGIINTLLYLLEDIRISIGNEYFNTVNPGHRLIHAETMSDLMATLDDILIELERYVNGAQTAVAPVWGELIRDYVLEHFRNPDLTVASLADSFNITPTYCSRMFKQATNQRLFDFIQLQRLTAAKELLSGDESLSAIAEACGFSSALTMSRAFKRYEGAAPSALREHMQPL